MWRAGGGSRRRRTQPAATTEGALSVLPTEVQDDVLARLPGREVVRTSILSRAWRRRWESVPGLDIELDGVRSWETAVGALERCAAPVRRVKISGIPLLFARYADSLLRLVASKQARSVSLELPARSQPAALPSVFSCDAAALAELRLRSATLPPPPAGFAGFHALASLSLDGVFFPAENGWKQAEAMVAAAPGLQELLLKDIVFHVADGSLPGKWVIGGPSLRRLVLCLWPAGAGMWELGALPKLEHASVWFNDRPGDRDYVKVITALLGVKELKIRSFDDATFQAPIFLTHIPHKFENIKVLKIDSNFYDISTFISTVCLLREAPFLQVLEITDSFRDGIVDEVDIVAGCMIGSLSWMVNPSLLNNLKYLRMISISCAVNDMYFIKHVLHTARNLLVVSVDMFEGSRKSAQEVSRQLKECHRASPEAKISIKHGDSYVHV